MTFAFKIKQYCLLPESESYISFLFVSSISFFSLIISCVTQFNTPAEMEETAATCELEAAEVLAGLSRSSASDPQLQVQVVAATSLNPQDIVSKPHKLDVMKKIIISQPK